MTMSMTGFARVEDMTPWGHVTIELRSVNQRYLEPAFRMPEALRALELEFRAVLKKRLGRGKVDCTIRLNTDSGAQAIPVVNEEAAAAVGAALDTLTRTTGRDLAVDGLELLRWPGILDEASPDEEQRAATLRKLFSDCVEGLVASRGREGVQLEQIILERLAEVEVIVNDVRAAVPVLQERQRNTIASRLADIAKPGDIDPGRLEQELAHLAQRADIAEELDRLDTHIAEIRGTFSDKGHIGRRLDFLMQELNREANTVASKASAAETALRAVDLKVLIEQMREQIQNVE